ncbi:MAG TPA: sulfite oxidase-like oxidoreductase [Terriglobia bacterium]|nr:sulfite oxidase-like oxidoreductase [Terriglobia bacterium]
MGLFTNNLERKLREQEMKLQGRLPPGQSLTLKWPVLHVGGVPSFDPATWDFHTSGMVSQPLRLAWSEFQALPRIQVTADFHCVTRWSRFDNHWEGVAFRTIAELTAPQPQAAYVLAASEEGYTTNVPLRDLLEPNVLFALQHDGQPLAAEHGGPLRLVVPKLYGWKSAKWVRSLIFLPEDRAGFWEQNGYHMYGDPQREQRFDTD